MTRFAKRRIAATAIVAVFLAGMVFIWKKSPKARAGVRTTLCVIGGFEVKRDFETLCTAFETANIRRQGRLISNLSTAERDELFQRLMAVKGNLCSEDVIGALSVYGSATPDTRIGFLKAVAVEKGIENWSCPAMEEFTKSWK
jgi:hypothetical protein